MNNESLIFLLVAITVGYVMAAGVTFNLLVAWDTNGYLAGVWAVFWPATCVIAPVAWLGANAWDAVAASRNAKRIPRARVL